MTKPERATRLELELLLEGLREDVRRGTIGLYQKHLAEDAVVLAMDDPRILRGKEACLDYFRSLGRQVRFHELHAQMETLKIVGDVAIALERCTTKYDVEEHTYQDTARITTVLVRDGRRWLLTHLHLESLAPNRVVK